jgi:Rieske Fe-S protein
MSARRRFLAAGLALLGLGRRMLSQATAPSGAVIYAPLTRVVKIPLTAVAIPWHPVPFVAEAHFQPAAAGATAAASRRVLISGVLFRTPEALSALCITCPHEQCQVDLVTDEERLARMAGGRTAHPLFECGCHSSVFDAAANGARVSGETPRGLYRFRIAGIREGIVEINEIEKAALSEV